MKIIVTGANGYLGQGIVKRLLDDGEEVLAADYRTDNVDARARKVECDIFEIDDPYNFFGQPDVLLHLAWRDGFVHYSLNHITDLPKHYLFLKKMVDSGVRKVAVAGSMHEIGFYEGSIDENTPCNPMSLYGISKNALRNCIQMLTKGKETLWQWLRAYYIVGNGENGNSIFSKIASAAKKGKIEFPFTMGLNQFDFLDYDVFCKLVAMTVEQDSILGVIEICSGRPEKLSDRVERFIKENKFNIKLQYGMFPDRPYDSKAVWGNSEKIEKIICQSENK